MLYQYFVSETGRKYGCLVDFFTTSLPPMRAYTHAHRCSLFKTGRKQVIDQSLRMEKMSTVYLN